ncbi:MAG: MotA/TolQ/ExbB proton channel family protein [Candidatus Sericytochromatia bacterium]
MNVAAALMNLLSLVEAGGGFIIPLFLASVLTGAVLLEQLWFSFLSGRRIKRLLLEPARWDQLGGMDMISRMLRSLVVNLQASEEVQKRDMDMIYGRFERRIQWLNTLAAVAPMLGLLGTVAGMIRIFSVISSQDMKNPLAQLSGGLSEALFATGGGLIVAIVAALGYHFLNSRLETLGQEMVIWYERHRHQLRPSK